MELNSELKQVFLNEIEFTDEIHPVIGTDGLLSCVAALIHTEQASYMMHLELLDNEDNSKSFKKYSDFIDSLKDDSKEIYIFKGLYTKEEDIQKLLEITSATVLDSFINIYKKGSIAYDRRTNKIFGCSFNEGVRKLYPMEESLMDYFKEVKNAESKEHNKIL